MYHHIIESNHEISLIWCCGRLQVSAMYSWVSLYKVNGSTIQGRAEGFGGDESWCPTSSPGSISA